MGVSGSGKSTVGFALAKALRWHFIEGDDHHPQTNLDKMASGEPLSDDDRLPWLANLKREIDTHFAQGQSVVVSCSALRRSFRNHLQLGDPGFRFVYLKGDYDLILGRMRSRPGHFMPPDLLRNQLDTLEEPDDAIVVNVTTPVDQIVTYVLAELARPPA
jgi:gluconokinase